MQRKITKKNKKGDYMDSFTIVNYQGSKKNLLGFIHDSLGKYINKEDVLLDIFAGTSSVAYSYKRKNRVYANDAEPYAAVMARALLGNRLSIEDITDFKKILDTYQNPSERYARWIKSESGLINSGNVEELVSFYETIPTVWTGSKKYFHNESEYSLFVKYYSTSYFGIEQAKDIDSIRFAIEKTKNENRDIFLSALFYAMKECVFSKDGHMAQPLDLKKNGARLLRLRSKNIREFFFQKCEEFASEEFIESEYDNKVFNTNFEKLLDVKKIKDVTVIYADPPYTDMQYSRYYHLLNTVLEYNYPELTVVRGDYTKGLYLENRFQSQLSKKSTCLESMKKLVEYSYKNNILLAISFAYPQDTEMQKTDRYVMDIDDLIAMCRSYYSDNRVKVMTQDYKHSNNRNSETKSVLEYLIICEREEKNE